MPTDPEEIIARVCRYCVSHGVRLGAVRLQKLVYLLECEFYRWERTRLTDLDWIFYHYGPWSRTLSDSARERFKLEPEILPDGRAFHDIRYSESDFYRMPDRFSDPFLQGMFITVMEAWADAPLEEVLDFVYFQTGPMTDARRGEALDFSKVPSAKEDRTPLDPYAIKSADRAKQLKEISARWRNRSSRRKPEELPGDEFLAEALKKMDAEDTSSIDAGVELAITDTVAKELRGDSHGH